MPAYSTFDSAITNLFAILSILIEIFSRAHAKEENSLSDFSFGAASMAVKGLILGSAALLTMDEDRFAAE